MPMKPRQKNTAISRDVNPRQLAAAVLHTAMDDSCGRVACESNLKARIRIRDDARLWFGYDHDGLFSFRGCCCILDLDPVMIKDNIRRRWGIRKRSTGHERPGRVGVRAGGGSFHLQRLARLQHIMGVGGGG